MMLLRKTACWIAAALIAAAPAGAKKPEPDAAPPPAPALWRISDEDSAVYIFGAIGLSPQGAPWRSRTVARAIDASETVWFEAPVDEPSAQAAANRIFSEEGMLPKGERLSSLLPSEAAEALAAIAEQSGLTAEALEPLRPWAAFVVLSARIEPATDAETVDAAILREARGRGRQLRYFDTIEDSLRILTEMPEGRQVELVSQLIAGFERQRAEARAGFEAWRTGDLEAADAYLNEPLRGASPEVYKRLVTDRIETIAGDIGAILKAPETAFIALNAGYLVGPDALPEALGRAGFKVERIAD